MPSPFQIRFQACLISVLPAAFVVHFVVKSEIDVFLLFVLFALDKKERFKVCGDYR